MQRRDFVGSLTALLGSSKLKGVNILEPAKEKLLQGTALLRGVPPNLSYLQVFVKKIPKPIEKYDDTSIVFGVSIYVDPSGITEDSHAEL